MKIKFQVELNLSPDLRRMLVSLISDRLDKIEAAVHGAAGRVTVLATQVGDLKAQIVELQAKVDSGGATVQEIARLDALVTLADQIDPTTPSVIPVPEPTP